MIVGFTGTRKGMSTGQTDQCAFLLMVFNRGDCYMHRGLSIIGGRREFHHGGARGADRAALAAQDPQAERLKKYRCWSCGKFHVRHTE